MPIGTGVYQTDLAAEEAVIKTEELLRMLDSLAPSVALQLYPWLPRRTSPFGIRPFTLTIPIRCDFRSLYNPAR